MKLFHEEIVIPRISSRHGERAISKYSGRFGRDFLRNAREGEHLRLCTNTALRGTRYQIQHCSSERPNVD